MYRILIVDDEAYIVQGLIGLIQKTEDLDLEVYKAYSAYEALDWLSRTKIDIVLSDITMPGIDGLALQKEINRLWPHCQLIFLTGYSDFSYVQEAVRHQAVDYILKAEGDEVILQSIRKAVQLLDHEFEQFDLLQQAKEQFHKAIPALQKDYLLDILQHEPRALKNLKTQLTDLRIPLSPDYPVLLVIGKVDDWQRTGGSSDKALLLYALQNIAAELLHTSVKFVSFVYDGSRVVWFLQPSTLQKLDENREDKHKRTIRFVEGSLETIQDNSRRLLNLKISFVFANQLSEWHEMSEKFDVLQRILNQSYYLGQEVLLTEDSLHLEKIVTQQRTGLNKMMKKMEQLEKYLESGLKEEFFGTLNELMIEANEDVLTRRVVIYHQLVVLFITYTAKEGRPSTLSDKFEKSGLTHYESHGSWEAAMTYFHNLAEQIFELKLTNAQQQHSHVVLKIKQFIEQNLEGDLSLTRIGEMLSLNPYYLSRLYKQLTGANLSETILEVRLERAKHLLGNTNMKIIDIATLVGFESNAYFHRVFKKATLLTPHEFRESVNSFK
ncbi:HTH-type transcriptional regulator YesS [compost metagenome]